MIKLDLTGAELDAYEAALLETHPMRVKVTMLDRDEKRIGELIADAGMSEGAVEVDTTADIWRQLSLTLIDPHQRIILDPRSPRSSSVFADKFVAVERGDWVDSLGKFVFCPVFWGCVARFERRGEEVTIEGLGKESLALDPQFLWRVIAIKRGTFIVTAIKRVMNAMGESRYSLPESKKKLKKAHHLGLHHEAWRITRHFAKTANWQSFYDGRGRLKARTAPGHPVWQFKTGENADVYSRPTVVYDWASEDIRNTIEVIGGTPKGQKKQIRVVARAPASHPLSPESLARTGNKRYIVQTVEDSNIIRKADAQALADRLLAAGLNAGLHVDFEALAIPHIEELDPISVNIDGETFTHVLRQFSIPLTAGDTMSLGASRGVKFPRRRKKK